jgi:endonuclease/exonuclease/phosphatase family metal-dependent hydrolase
MRVASFNILHGRTVGDGVDPQRLRDCVRRLDPDVLALQEVDCDQPRSERADLTAAAADAMGAVEHRFVAAISGTPGATWVAATGREQPGTAAYGIALLSRFPVASWQVVRLPRIPMRFPMYLPGPNKVMMVDEEPRAAVIAQVHTPLGALTVANTHLSFVPGWNRRQLRRLVHDLRGLPGPRLLTGDLNLTPAAVRRWTGMRPSTPTWLGHPASVTQRVLERLDAELSDADDDGRPALARKVAIVSVAGNEDGAHKCIADIFQALNDVGYSIPAQGCTYCNGAPMQATDYNDLDEIPNSVASATAAAARNAAHLAGILKSAHYPPYE